MKAFAALLDRLAFTPARNTKLRVIEDYFRSTPDPDRGYALAALTGSLDFPAAKPAMVRGLVESRVDPLLFRWSYDYVGDLAETVALIWPSAGKEPNDLTLTEVVDSLRRAGRSEVPAMLATWLDGLDATGRWALLKLITGGLRVGVSARLAKTALAQLGGVAVSEIEEVWHGLSPPYPSLFAWLDGRQDRPTVDPRAAFRPLMLAHPLEAGEQEKLDANDYRAEWKWDGIRVQLVAAGGALRLFSRSGDNIAGSFPDIAAVARFDAVLDGELLVMRDGQVAAFNDLQQRLNRKTVSAKLLERFPAHVRLYDILYEGPRDLRHLPFDQRRQRLDAWFEETNPERMDLSPLLPFASWDELAALRADARAHGIEGLMLKHRQSPYIAGRPRGPWFKWKRDALTCDAVLMYAQRGHGKRSSFYSDYTFGAWRRGEDGGPELVPIGKAYFGFTDEELRQLDRWVRNNTAERFGPVRAVKPGLVLEVAFDAVQRSTRHKSGLALRFPRIHRIRWDKPIEDAERLESIERLIEP